MSMYLEYVSVFISYFFITSKILKVMLCRMIGLVNVIGIKFEQTW
jgi:hypothetical protein